MRVPQGCPPPRTSGGTTAWCLVENLRGFSGSSWSDKGKSKVEGGWIGLLPWVFSGDVWSKQHLVPTLLGHRGTCTQMA